MAPRIRITALALALLTALSACVSRTATDSKDPPEIESRETAITTPIETETRPTATETVTVSETPTRGVGQLEPAAIERVFQVYLNGLANHDMIALKSATCPELRDTLLGFELHGHYVAKWVMLPYEVPVDSEYLVVRATVTQSVPSTGALAGDVVHSWNVERAEDRTYYVCGWLDY